MNEVSFRLLLEAVCRQAVEDYAACMRNHYKSEWDEHQQMIEMRQILRFFEDKFGKDVALTVHSTALKKFKRGEKLLNASFAVFPGKDARHPAKFVCPFCGEKAKVFFSKRNSTRKGFCLFVSCHNCGITEYRTWKEGKIPLLPFTEG